MNQNVKTVQQKIESLGGSQTSQMLSRIFGETNQEFGKDFNVDQFFDDLWEKNCPSDERWSREIDSTSNWNGNGNNNGYNIIPAVSPNGICATFCLTIIPRGFRMIGPTSSSRRFNRLNFSKAILLLCDYWFACLNINEENLLVTNDWDQVTFENHYENVINSYTTNHNKKVFIIEVSKVGPILRYPY